MQRLLQAQALHGRMHGPGPQRGANPDQGQQAQQRQAGRKKHTISRRLWRELGNPFPKKGDWGKTARPRMMHGGQWCSGGLAPVALLKNALCPAPSTAGC